MQTNNQENEMNYELLNGVIDTHVHSSPDCTVRKFNDIELATDARRVGAKAIVLNSHALPTVDRAEIAHWVVPEVDLFGGVVLNYQIGGLNLAAVTCALKMGAKIIWLPTLDASNQYSYLGKEGGIDTVKNGRVVPQLLEIFRAIAEANAILATGHPNTEELCIIVDQASALGVQKILINHPELYLMDVPFDIQKDLAKYPGVYFERCCNTKPKNKNYYVRAFDVNLAAIHEVGYQNTILATDVGQPHNPNWADAMLEHISYMVKGGLSEHVIETITKTNASRLLDLANE